MLTTSQGVVYFRRDPYKYKKTFFVDVIPRENPNRTMRPPPPYCYHPELFPELAKNNPQPFVVTKKQKEIEPKPTKEPSYKIVESLGAIEIPDHFL